MPAQDHPALTRRRFLRTAAAAFAVPGLTGCASRMGRADGVARVPAAPPVVLGFPLPPPVETIDPTLHLGPTPATPLPTPDLSDGRVIRFAAGLRPYRRGTVRVEGDTLAGKPLIHHYGHGGSGFTLAWGTAEEAADLLAERLPPPAGVGVLGGGVVGLTTAIVLLERGYTVTVYAKALSPNTTSDLAGAQFAPSLVECDDRDRLDRWVRASAKRYLGLRGDAYGVYERPNYATGRGGSGLRRLPTDVFPMRELDALPFDGPPRAGRMHQTMLIEPPVYLPRMQRRVYEESGRIRQRTFASPDDVAALTEGAVVNCMGLGSGSVFPDGALQPMRGQLVLMQPQELPYLLSHSGYLFPRRDAIVLGGTVERGVDSAEPVPSACRRILENHRRFFA